MKVKIKLKRILKILIICIFIILLKQMPSKAESLSYSVRTDDQLRSTLINDDDFSIDPKSILKTRVSWTSNLIFKQGCYCIHDHTNSPLVGSSNAPYEVESILDVNLPDNKGYVAPGTFKRFSPRGNYRYTLDPKYTETIK